MPTGQDLIVAIITLGALLVIVRNIMKGRRSGCGRGGCGCESTQKSFDDRMGRRRELIQLQVNTPEATGTESRTRIKSQPQ